MSEDLQLFNFTCVVAIPPLRGESFFFPPQKTRSDLEVTILNFFENSVRTPAVQCKNLAFYTTESLNEPFFAEQKRKNGAGKKIKTRYSLPGPPLDSSHVQNPTEFSDFWWDDGRMMVFGRGGKPFSVG